MFPFDATSSCLQTIPNKNSTILAKHLSRWILFCCCCSSSEIWEVVETTASIYFKENKTILTVFGEWSHMFLVTCGFSQASPLHHTFIRGANDGGKGGLQLGPKRWLVRLNWGPLHYRTLGFQATSMKSVPDPQVRGSHYIYLPDYNQKV